MVAAFREMLDREPLTMTTFPNEQGYDDLVLVREIPFTSLCAHHLLPFRGVAHVGYLPAKRLLGLSKLARVVEHFARDLQLQERLTVQIADYLASELAPNGVGVVLEAEHLCMSIRGPRPRRPEPGPHDSPGRSPSTAGSASATCRRVRLVRATSISWDGHFAVAIRLVG